MRQSLRRFIRIGRLAFAAALPAALLALPSCVYDRYNDGSQADGGVAVELSIVTRAITSDSYTYELGSTWENYINIAGGDYKIYFFTNDKDDATATDDSGRNTLIAEFVPQEMTSVDGSTYTQYTLAGSVGEDIIAYSDFKVVVLANWRTYPTVTAGETTIDALVEGGNATFSAETLLTGVDSSHLIPFFGVREYSGVEWRQGWRTTLSGDITLLRAVAKVEVILNAEDSDIEGFDSVVLNRYNSTGYCAPSGVYLRADYDSGYTDWAGDFANTIHLVGGANDSGASSRTYSFNHQQTGTTADVWTIYLPEYDNTSDSDDYSFIRVTIDGTEYEIYFANYSDGVTTAYGDGEDKDMPDRYDIFRNCLYRFYVTVNVGEKEVTLIVRAHVDKWEECFDNEYIFDAE